MDGRTDRKFTLWKVTLRSRSIETSLEQVDTVGKPFSGPFVSSSNPDDGFGTNSFIL